MYRIAIVGFGSGGVTAAILLARQGNQVHLFERALSNEPVGAGFLLQPSGMKVLKDMGILHELLPDVAIIDKLYCENLSGRTMLNLYYSELEPSMFGAGTHRGTFLSLLEKHALSSGVQIHWGTPIRSLSQDEKVTIIDESANPYANFDTVIVADGARSSIRSQLDIPQSDKKYPWGALWFIGERTKEFSPNVLWQSVDSTNLLNGFLPTGTDEDLLSLFWSVRVDQIEHLRSKPIEKWKSEVLHLAPQAESYLDQIHSHHQMKTAEYHDVVMPYWNDKKVVVIGDAAHALSPQLGQGVNLELIDAAELAHQISENPIEVALSKYSKNRKKHLKFYQRATRWATPFFQSDYRSLGCLRDIAFPVANKIPYFRRQMVASMAGLKTGPFTSLPVQPHKDLM